MLGCTRLEVSPVAEDAPVAKREVPAQSVSSKTTVVVVVTVEGETETTEGEGATVA